MIHWFMIQRHTNPNLVLLLISLIIVKTWFALSINLICKANLKDFRANNRGMHVVARANKGINMFLIFFFFAKEICFEFIDYFR